MISEGLCSFLFVGGVDPAIRDWHRMGRGRFGMQEFITKAQPVVGRPYFSDFPILWWPGMDRVTVSGLKDGKIVFFIGIEVVAFQELQIEILGLGNGCELFFR